MGATEKIARFIVETDYENIPRDAVEKAKRTALDCIGAALAGIGEPVSRTITAYVKSLGGPAQASVFGADFRASVADAALINGISSHVFEYDDTLPKNYIHPSPPVASALFAHASAHRVQGRIGRSQRLVKPGVEPADVAAQRQVAQGQADHCARHVQAVGPSLAPVPWRHGRQRIGRQPLAHPHHLLHEALIGAEAREYRQ